MKKFVFFLFFINSFLFVFSQNNYIQYVNTFVGTDFTGHTYPGALVPFGGVQVSPDTKLDGWQGCSGYHYEDSRIYGFSHTHLSGTGCSDYGDILLMPFCEKASLKNEEYASPFSHKNEHAEAGYYSVILDKDQIKVELTASKRVGVHRYTFPKNTKSKGVILDLTHRDIVLHSAIKYDAKKKALFGARDSKAWNPEQKLDFSILFSEPVQNIEFYLDDQLVDSVDGITGKNCKAIIYFAPEVSEIILKVAISGIGSDIEDAHINQAEIPDFDFDRIKENAQKSWNLELGKIAVESQDLELKRTFYSALYHCFTSPYLYTDIEGNYRGMDGKIHKAVDHDVYTVFSLWDTYRALHPLLSIIDRKRTGDFIYTFMKHYEQGKMLPVWELSGYETWCMIGYHSVPVILDAYIKGISNSPTPIVLDAMVHSAKLNKLGRPEFGQFGFIPADKEHESVSKTLEYAYDDWCIAEYAKQTDNQYVYEEFCKRSQYYKNIIDANGFAHQKINSAFVLPFSPTEVNNNFTEANSWQYSTYVPHDFNGYIRLIGGMEIADRFLDSLFNTYCALSGRQQADVTGLVGQYAHGNEPSHHAAYLYNFVGKPWKTQSLVRKITRELYTSQPDGLCGNEDCGQMSAWYVFSAMGFYPVCPGDNKYIIGSPIFDKVTVNLENGEQFTVVTTNQSPDNKYIKSCKLNGKKYNLTYITYNDIKDGGLLEFEMSSTPNIKWGSKAEDCPQNIVPPTLTQVPIFSTSQRTFKESLTVSIYLYEPARKEDTKWLYPASTDQIFYTLDGTTPTKKSQKYEKPLFIDQNCTLKAVAWNAETGYSNVIEAEYIKFQKDKSIQLITPYSSQYTGGGNDALIDCFRGTVNFRLGGWQGFNSDFEAIVDLESIKEIREVSVGFLQSIRSWIWFPTQVEVEISDNKSQWKSFGTYNNPYPINDDTDVVKDFSIQGKATARYVKIKAKNFGTIPDWHLGAGGKAWIFVDEIIVK